MSLFDTLGSFLDPGDPYAQARDTYKRNIDDADQFQKPFFEAGTRAIPRYEDYLSQFEDPEAYLSHIMGGYSESPYAQNLRQNMMRSAKNTGSATGLGGSTAMNKFIMNQAGKISSGDMQQYLSNILGIGGQYGEGQLNLMRGGQKSGNILSDLRRQIAENLAGLDYKKGAVRQEFIGNILGGYQGGFNNPGGTGGGYSLGPNPGAGDIPAYAALG